MATVTATGGARARIGVAFFYHESHSFSPLLTDLDAFNAEDHHIGDRIIEVYEGTQTEVGGFLAALTEHDAIAVPLTAAAAMPAGEVTSIAYMMLREEFSSYLRQAHSQQPLDGLLLALHGSMVAESEQDPEGDFVRIARSILGPTIPISVTLDLHANVSATLVNEGALVFGYQTYPHTDMRQQGERAAHALLDVLDGQSVVSRYVRLPMLLRSINMRTAQGPMADVVAFGREREGAGVYAVSPHSGFPYADTFCSGAAVTVVADSADTAERVCREVAEYFWSQRERFQVDVEGIEQGLAAARNALAAGETPVVLADVADNPQSGGSADTTELLSAALSANLGRLLASAIYDPAVVAQALDSGVGRRSTFRLAGKSSPQFGATLEVDATVIALGDGVFENDGPFNAGLQVDTGGAVLLRLHAVAGVATKGEELGLGDVLVTGRPITANDPALYRHLGVDPLDYDVLVWKVKNHFRAAFESIVGRIIPVDAPGAAQTDFTKLTFRNVDVSTWPFDAHRKLGPLCLEKPRAGLGDGR
jgi:microcystin degradation protein MlrC